MHYEVEFSGGVKTGKNDTKTVKFFLFLLSDQEETPLWEAARFGMATSIGTGSKYQIPTQYVKLFIYQTEFGRPAKSLSLYLRLLKPGDDIQTVTIRPFDLWPVEFGFKAKAKFMSSKEVFEKQLVLANSISWKMLKNQRLPPKPLLKKMIKIERGLPTPKLGSRRKIRPFTAT